MGTSPRSTRRRPNRWTEVFSNPAAGESFHLEAPTHPDPEKGTGGDRGGIDIPVKRDGDRGGGRVALPDIPDQGGRDGEGRRAGIGISDTLEFIPSSVTEREGHFASK